MSGLKYLLKGAGIGGLTLYLTVLPFWSILSSSLIAFILLYFIPRPDLVDPRGKAVFIRGRFTVPSLTAYCMSKHAIVSFSDGLRREISKFGVKVSTVEPGFYRRKMAEANRINEDSHKSWMNTSVEVRESYGGDKYFEANMAKIDSAIQQGMRPNVQEVTDAVVASIRDADPQYTYHPHWTTWLRTTIFTNMPTAVLDWILTSKYVRV